MLSFIACCTHIYEWFQVTRSLFACWFQPGLISHDTVFFSHNKSAPAVLISPKINQRTRSPSLEVSCYTNNFYVSNVLVSGPSDQSCFYISVDWTLPYLNQIVDT